MDVIVAALGGTVWTAAFFVLAAFLVGVLGLAHRLRPVNLRGVDNHFVFSPPAFGLTWLG